jgi:hypothetical protein
MNATVVNGGNAVARKSKPGEHERALATCPDHAREMIKILIVRAKQGHPEAADSVFRWLEVFPQLKPEFRELDDLVNKTESAWVRAVGFGDPLAERAAQDELAAMKAELLGPGASVLEKILVSAVVVAHLAHQRAAMMAASPANQSAVSAMRDRRLTATQKRLLAAVKAWELIAEKKAKGLRPKGKLELFEPDSETA